MKNPSQTRYLSPLAAWALAFGCAVGWGSFVMPGTTFLPSAGPLGSVLGLLIGAALMAIIGINYYQLMKRHPDAGGAYAYAKEIYGFDHGFICAWMLILTYIAIIWANSTALCLLVRYLFGDFFCFGFSYEIAGYTIYFGEVLLSASFLIAAGFVCAFSRRLMKWVQVVCALALFVGVAVCFVSVVIHNGGFERLSPAFAKSGDPALQVISIVILAPWAFIGFESISHSTGEFNFRVKKSLPVIMVALLTGVLTYGMLVVCAAMAKPDGFANWSEYIGSLSAMEGIKRLPTFFGAQEAMGTAGTVLLGIAAFGGVVTALIANNVALSRLFQRLAEDKLMPGRLGRTTAKGLPATAVMCVTAVSCVIPLLGRTAIGWIVDVTTIGAAIIYAYVSVSAYSAGKREKNSVVQLFGVLGALIAVGFVVVYLVPGNWTRNRLATESYLLLIIWSVLGMAVFRFMIHRDKERKLGKSEAVWIILLGLILVVSVVWIYQVATEEATNVAGDIGAFRSKQVSEAGLSESDESVRAIGEYINTRLYDYVGTVMKNVLVQISLIAVSLVVVFSIFSIIKKREKQIEAERLRAEESNKAKSVFLSNMSHDIRTPMNAIMGYTALALNEELPDNVRGYLEKINTSGRHLLALINDILDMSRIESGKMELEPVPDDLAEILDEVRDMFAMQMEGKKLAFTVDYARITDRYVVVDRNRLNRILLNLISNALKFTPSGGSVTVTLAQTGTAEGKGSYELRVADTGIGMSKEFAAHIFDAFERERTETVSKIQGTGLGMSITKNLVELMGGTVTVQTEKDKGTEFLLRLQFPLASGDEVEKREKENETAEQTDFSGKKLLLAEDNPINSEIAKMILTHEGFEVDVAENGKIAVEMMEAAAEGEYCVVLMDMQMPVMNGLEASRAIRSMAGKKGRTPIIAMTANTFEEDRQKTREAGMNAHLGKPFQPAELLAVIAAQIQQ